MCLASMDSTAALAEAANQRKSGGLTLRHPGGLAIDIVSDRAGISISMRRHAKRRGKFVVHSLVYARATQEKCELAQYAEDRVTLWVDHTGFPLSVADAKKVAACLGMVIRYAIEDAKPSPLREAAQRVIGAA